jgi:hypothetical protein
MNKRIIYENELGGIAILTPVLSSELTIEELARKDVPAGIPYKIINVEDIPTDRTFRNAWEADFSSPDGYGIGHAAWFAEREGNV